MATFSEHLADFRSLAGWSSKATILAFSLPVLAALAGWGPPTWVAPLVALMLELALVLLVRGLAGDAHRTRWWIALMVTLVLGLAGYVAAASQLIVYEDGRSAHVIGLRYLEPQLFGPGAPYRDGREAMREAGWDAYAIWTPGSITVAWLCLSGTWSVMFAGLAGLCALGARSSDSLITPQQRRELEKLLEGSSIFLDIAQWRQGLGESEARTCRIDYQGMARGTGVLIGPDLVLTNHHVVEPLLGASPEHVHNWTCRFDHKLSESGDIVAAGRIVALVPDWCVDALPPSEHDAAPDPKPEPSDEELDFALLRLAEPAGHDPVDNDAGRTRGWVAVRSDIDEHEPVIAIIQHPRGLPMKLALALEKRLSINKRGNRVRYEVATEPGSSGAPVFDSNWRLVALHHSGDPGWKPEYNEGIPLGKILARPRVAAALGQSQSNQGSSPVS